MIYEYIYSNFAIAIQLYNYAAIHKLTCKTFYSYMYMWYMYIVCIHVHVYISYSRAFEF